MARAQSTMDALFDDNGASEILSFPADQDGGRRSGPADAATPPPAGDDWQGAVTHTLARLDASERRTLETLDRLRQRVARIEADLTDLREGTDRRVQSLEREIVALNERLEPLEDRAFYGVRR